MKIFSQPFLQGTKIAKFTNEYQDYGFFLFFVKGVFCVVYSSSTSFVDGKISFFLTGGKELLLDYLSRANDNSGKMILINGFTLTDLDKVSSNVVVNGTLGVPNETNIARDVLQYFGSIPTGYIEPQETDSIELQAHAIKATKYGVEMSNLLTQNGISHVSFQNFSAI